MAKGNAVKKVAPVEEKVTDLLSKAQRKAVEALKGPSKQIRYLTDEGFSRVQITKSITNARGGKLLYQHVKGVQDQAIAKAAKAKANK